MSRPPLLEILSDLADRYGNHRRAAELREMGSTLRANVLRKMWDASRGRFCDSDQVSEAFVRF